MCYLLYLSTTSDQDLTARGTDRFAFVPLRDRPDDRAAAPHLKHDHTWYVSWMGGCSCGFRHHETDEPHRPWFSAPEDWCPEDDEDVANTAELYRVIADMVGRGHAVDCLDVWCLHDGATDFGQVPTQTVGLREVPEASFRLFVGYRFEFVATYQEPRPVPEPEPEVAPEHARGCVGRWLRRLGISVSQTCRLSVITG